jgi:Cd2+/Zn2+-exporting ATPase
MTTDNIETTLQIEGLDCPSCVNSLERAVNSLPGVTNCELLFTTQKLKVKGNIPTELIIDRVREMGYEIKDAASSNVVAASNNHNRSFMQYIWTQPEARLALFGFLLILPGLIFNELLGWEHPLIWILSLAAIGVAGWPIAKDAIGSLRINHEININLLMVIASVGAVIIGAYTEAGMIMVLFALGEALEGYTLARSRDSLRNLMEVVPQSATMLTEKDDVQQEQRVNVEDLQIGNLVLVKPGERIPMDGRIIAGYSHINQAPITGESRLVEKTPGTEVFASSINMEGALVIEVTHLAQDNTISRMIELVTEAQEKRAPTQRFIDRFAKFYTPAVVILAVMVATIPPILFNQPFLNPDPQTHGWLYRALALLVISCPCALVISTPVSLISAISNAARNGVIIKGGTYLEALSQVKAFAYDKTGTLTQGKPSVVGVQSTNCENHAIKPATFQQPPGLNDADMELYCDSCNDLLALANAVEQRSEHPLAQAVINESTRRGLQNRYAPAENVSAMIGSGVTGEVTGRKVLLGSHRYFDTYIPHQAEYCEQAENYAGEGYTPILVGYDGEYAGTITVADTLRDNSHEAINMLKQSGIDTHIMLTGDDQRTARLVGEETGMTEVRAGLLPGDKLTAIRELQAQFNKVAMVGDGINDTPALAASDVGIAISGATSGTAQALETADITLMNEDLRKLPFTYRLSRKTMRIIYANIALSLGLKFTFLLLVLLGYGTMWMAVLADVGTTLLVTLNGMRLLRDIKI